MKFRSKLLLLTITVNVIAITCIYIIVKVNAHNAVSKITEENARNLLEMAKLSIENQYTSLEFHQDYSSNLRKTERQNIIAIAKSTINKYYTDYQNGLISESAAKKLALQSIDEFRYDNGNGYIWINDTKKPIPRILIHPIYPEYNNQISTAPIFFSSSDSSNIPRLAVDLCELEGAGFIEYFWSKPISLNNFEKIPKISYVEIYKPWQWILGTGVYMEDIENDSQQRLNAIIEELKQTIGNIKIAETGYFYMFNSERELLIHPVLLEESDDSIIKAVSDKIPYDEVIQAEKTVSKSYKYIWNKPTVNEIEYIYEKTVFVDYYEPMDWYLCVSFYEDELSKPGILLGRRILLISAIFLLISVIVSIQISSGIAKPLNNLMKFVSKISLKEKIDTSKIPTSGSYETKQLGERIKEMLISIEEQKNKLIKAKLIAENNELKLRENEKKYQAIFESSNDSILLLKDFRVVDFNHKTKEIFQCSDAYILGKTLADVSPEFQPDGQATKDKVQKNIKEFNKKDSLLFEWRHSKENGEPFDALISLSSVSLGDEKNYVQVVVRDITEKKKTEKELDNHRNNLEKLIADRTNDLETNNEELAAVNDELFQKNEIVIHQKEELEATITQLKNTQTQLIQAEKMASLGVLTAGIAHEINNPLNFITGGTMALENILIDNKLSNEPKINTIIKSLKTGTERISSIVRGLNHFSRDKEVYDEECDLQTIIDNCLTILHNQYKNKVEIRKNFIDELPIIKGNVGKLHQAFLNLIHNAIDSIQESGTITISTELINNKIVVNIIDTGEGIEKENLNKITDPFFTTKDPGKGTGLGLSITYNIIKDHDGELEIDSKLGEGTVVRLTFSMTE